MKVVIILVVFLAVVLIGVKYLDTELKTREFGVQTAFGEVTDMGIQMDIALTAAMVERESPDGSTQYNSTWQRWMERHFELRDDSGQVVDIKYQNGSKLISAKPGSPEQGFLRAFLVPGKTYTLRYQPILSEPLVAEGEITAPHDRRSLFLLKLVAR